MAPHLVFREISQDLDASNPAKTGSYTLVAVVLTTFTTVALYNSIELIILIFRTFKTYSGLYFWSILLSSFGILPYGIAEMLEFYGLMPRWLSGTINNIGWTFLVTGQSVVLYSRLHLVVKEKKILTVIKWMIIINAIIIDIPAWILNYFYLYEKPGPSIYYPYGIFTKFQMTVYCTQELILSGLYVWKVGEMLKEGFNQAKEARKMSIELAVVNIIIIIMDIAVLVLQYVNLYNLMMALKSFIYSVKLKLEFAILGKLVDLASHHSRRLNTSDTFSDAEPIDGHQLASSPSNFGSKPHGPMTRTSTAKIPTTSQFQKSPTMSMNIPPMSERMDSHSHDIALTKPEEFSESHSESSGTVSKASEGTGSDIVTGTEGGVGLHNDQWKEKEKEKIKSNDDDLGDDDDDDDDDDSVLDYAAVMKSISRPH